MDKLQDVLCPTALRMSFYLASFSLPKDYFFSLGLDSENFRLELSTLHSHLDLPPSPSFTYTMISIPQEDGAENAWRKGLDIAIPMSVCIIQGRR
ncbi:hypothetical protein TNCT_343421 [Trichonephila clavata]|uniref:Uncharacterized protein n=1 Tax=Trichonephila clavata TaxID=2740835 RepID=A0A8X6GMQ7_TRICU|nr:hypothetical protein TNCT_343421 [Trichonephila clavata]